MCLKLDGFICLPCLVTVYCWNRWWWAVCSLIWGAVCKSFNNTEILKDKCFELFLLTSEKKYCLYWERLYCILGTNKRLLYWERWPGSWREAEKGLLTALAPTEGTLRQDKAAADAKWAEYWVAQLVLLTVLGNFRSQMSRSRPSGWGLSLSLILRSLFWGAV